jgi:hypothetical protein
MKLQLNTRASVRFSREFGTHMLMYSFHLGPLEVFCLSHLPKEGDAYSRTYVKVGLRSRSVLEEGRKVEAWDLQDGEARSAAGHARVSGGIPGGRVAAEFALGPMHLHVSGDGEVAAKIAPRKTVEHESKVIEHWAAVPDPTPRERR